MTDCFIGLDLGTSGCRGLAVDQADRILAEHRVSLPPPRRDSRGASTQDPEVWWRALLEVLGKLALDLAGHRSLALGLDATATSLLICDADGRPRTPALMYDDRQALAQARFIREQAPADSPVHGPTSSLSKLLLLATTGPGRGTLVLHQADWLIGRLCGRFGFSDWNNCLKLGFDPASESWPGWLRKLVPSTIRLPQVLAPGTPVGSMRRQLAQRLGLPPDLRICAGTTDSTAAVLASGADAAGDGVTVLGSTLVVKQLCERPLSAPELGVYSHRLGELWLAGGASNSGGAVLRKFFDDAVMQALTRRLRPEQPTGLDYYPLCRPGERFPVNDPQLAPRLSPRPADDAEFFQGMLEGMAAIESKAYGILAEMGAPRLRRVISIGGGAANPAWRSIRSALLGVPVSLSPHEEAAFGAARLARGDLSR